MAQHALTIENGSGRAADAVIPTTPQQMQTPTENHLLTAFLRRFRRSLYDSGILDLVGPDWIRADFSGPVRAITFGALTVRHADRLLCSLEDLAIDADDLRERRHAEETPAQAGGSEQLRLF